MLNVAHIISIKSIKDANFNSIKVIKYNSYKRGSDKIRTGQRLMQCMLV